MQHIADLNSILVLLMPVAKRVYKETAANMNMPSSSCQLWRVDVPACACGTFCKSHQCSVFAYLNA